MNSVIRFLFVAMIAIIAPDTSSADDERSRIVASANEMKSVASARLAKQFPFLAKVPRVRENSGDYVVLVHGFSWAKPPLFTLGRYLNRQGFHTIEIHYPIRSIPVDEVLDHYVLTAVKEHCTDLNRKVHFVGHSMGSIVVRKLLKDREVERVGHVVLLAAPNQGTEMADFFGRAPVLGNMLGEFLRQVGVGKDSLPNQLGPVDFSPGIIMGTRSDFPIVASVLPGSDDGVVTVDSGRVEGMAELITLPTTHIRMPSAKIVQTQIVHFLRSGRFSPDHHTAKTAWLTF